MKIVVVTMVKNEEAFIESSVRYWLTFADQVILFDHYSTDGTMAILQDLISEFGERLILFNPYLTIGFEKKQALVINTMTNAAFEQYNADMVLPLDADEYPYLPHAGSLREFFCTLPQESCYKAYWIPVAPPEDNYIDPSMFAPLAFTRRKSVPMPSWEKTIITRECYKQFKPQLAMGNHDFVNNGRDAVPQRKDLTPQLFYAHFACRGKSHYLIKNFQGWLSNYSNKNWIPGNSVHYQFACEQIVRENGDISQKVLDWYALSSNGLTGESVEDIQNCIEVFDPGVVFPEISIKYTPEHIVNKDPIIMLFESALRITEQYRETFKKTAELQIALSNTERELAETRNTMDGMLQSHSWKLTAPLRYCSERFRRE